MSERKTISNGIGWMRFLLIPVVLVLLSEIIYSESRWIILPFFLLSLILYYRLKNARKIKIDDQFLYLVYGKNEKVIPFQQIKSIKRSASKVNGSRYWILKYELEEGKSKSVRYFRDFFNKEFHNAVRLKNPDVVIWTHPHFNH
jgi:hypothetical protein